MSTRPTQGRVFGPYDAERALANDIETVYCTRCPLQGRRTALVLSADAIGRLVERCPVCDGVAPRRDRPNPNEVLKPQALVGPAQLLPPCPPGVLRCQHCAKPVEGDERLCVKCALPGLSRADRVKAQWERIKREEAGAPKRPAPELPRPLFPDRAPLVRTQAEAAPRKAGPLALAKAVASVERAQQPRRKARAASLVDPRRSEARRNAVYKDKPCEWAGCGKLFSPSGPRSRYCGAHS